MPLIRFQILAFTCLLVQSSSSTQDRARSGIQIVGSEGVAKAAIERAATIADAMLQNAPLTRSKMEAKKFRILIIGRNQVISDLPDYAGLRGKKTFDGRTFDQGTRGIGESDRCSVGEENLLCLSPQKYFQEDILVHEFAHSILSNLGEDLSRLVQAAFENARRETLYPSDIYMMANAHEYWAEGTQVWFRATARHDVNGGFNTPELLQARDPALTSALQTVYGKPKLEPLPNCAY